MYEPTDSHKGKCMEVTRRGHHHHAPELSFLSGIKVVEVYGYFAVC